jgi:hypothetical protein
VFVKGLGLFYGWMLDCKVRKQPMRFLRLWKRIVFQESFFWRTYHFGFPFNSMKTSWLTIALLAFTVKVAQGQDSQPAASTSRGTIQAQDTTYAVVDRGANHRVWQKTTYETLPDGKQIPHIHKYTELATGMHYKNAKGQWVESKEEIEAFSSGAIARQGQYQVIFANNLNSTGAIDMQTPDGKRLRSNVLGLGYYDKSTGNSVLIAQVQDSEGELIFTNQVLYPNAFNGLKADVRYTYKRGRFEQDVILREQPPTPESYGLNSATTELEMITEFINPPEPTAVHRGHGKINDKDINWGIMHIGHGSAFDLSETKKRHSETPVTKEYGIIQNRNILLEKVPVKRIQSELKGLPVQAEAIGRLKMVASKELALPSPRVAGAGFSPIRMATARPSEKGYLLDYVALDSSMTDYTFNGNTTYYVSGEFNLSGTTTIEGGAVIK